MNCVRPPLLKKPSRGFAWACGPCSRAQEKKLEARNVPILNQTRADVEEDEPMDEDDEDTHAIGSKAGTSSDSAGEQDDSIRPASAEQVAHSKLWPYRYLGIHCRVEDALDYDDRIYPRASSRLGPRHQANVTMWPGRPIQYIRTNESRKRAKGSWLKKDPQPSKESGLSSTSELEKLPKDKRPKWVLDEPHGYVRRGEDHKNGAPETTAKAIYCPPQNISSQDAPPQPFESNTPGSNEIDHESLVDDYMTQARLLAKDVGVAPYSTNFLDKALEVFTKNDFDLAKSLSEVKMLHKRRDLKEPDLNKEELKRFEEGITRYGSELHSVAKHVKSQKESDIVRFYYIWKKTERGRQIWGNYEGRKGKKEARRMDSTSGKFIDDAADDCDDSAFDSSKASERKRGFECKFCLTTKSRQWRRAPGVAPGTLVSLDHPLKSSGKEKSIHHLVALCRRCAELWRRYGIQWEDMDEVAKKVAQGGGRAWKRRIDEELLKELVSGNDSESDEHLLPSLDDGKITTVLAPHGSEALKKKSKISMEKDPSHNIGSAHGSPGLVSENSKKRGLDKTSAPPSIPERPKPKTLPCAVCDQFEPTGDQSLVCRDCRMTVHRGCYGVSGDVRSTQKWICDMCANDKNPQVSTVCQVFQPVTVHVVLLSCQANYLQSYACVLCPVRISQHDFVEAPKLSHKKKTDKEREKDRLEREAAIAAADFYRKRQEETNRPVDPREPLKRTAGNNWVHVSCAVWTPELKFGTARALEPSEGIGTIPFSRYEQICKLCKTKQGACVSCHQCHASGEYQSEQECS